MIIYVSIDNNCTRYHTEFPMNHPTVSPGDRRDTCRCDSSTKSCRQSAATSLLAVSSSDPVRAVARPVVILRCYGKNRGNLGWELGKKI